MAGSATIRVSGDVKQALAALEQLGLKAEETGKKAEAAFGDKLAAAGERTSGVFQRIGNTMGNWGIPFSESVSKMGDRISEAETKGQKFGATMAEVGKATLLAGTAGFAVVAAESIKMAGNFQSASEHLVTDAGESQAALKGVEQGMLAISSATGTSSEAIVDGMYHIESAGYHGQAGLQILKTAAEGAKVGGADLNTVAQTLTGTMRAYNIPASQAVSTMNQLITTVGSGDMKMQDLASSLGNVAPIAAAAHVSLAQVGGAVATMTAQNMSAQQATQDVANAIGSLQAPNQVAINEMAQFGLNSNTVSQQLGSKGLTGTLQELTTAIASKMGPSGQVFVSAMNQSVGAAKDMQIELQNMPKNLQTLASSFESGHMTVQQYRTAIKALPADEQAMASGFISTYNQAHKFNALLTSGSPAAQTYTAALSKMMGGATGLNTALMLTGGNAAEFQKNVDAIAASAQHSGNNVDNWGAIQKTFNQQLDVAKTTVENLGIKLGLILIPVLETVAHDTMQVVSWFEQHKAAAEALAIVIGGVLSVAITAFTVQKIAGFINGIKSAAQEMQNFAGTMTSVAATVLEKLGIIDSETATKMRSVAASWQGKSAQVEAAQAQEAAEVEATSTAEAAQVEATAAGMSAEVGATTAEMGARVNLALESGAAEAEGTVAGEMAAIEGEYSAMAATVEATVTGETAAVDAAFAGMDATATADAGIAESEAAAAEGAAGAGGGALAAAAPVAAGAVAADMASNYLPGAHNTLRGDTGLENAYSKVPVLGNLANNLANSIGGAFGLGQPQQLSRSQIAAYTNVGPGGVPLSDKAPAGLAARAAGGPVRAGVPYWVGEKGPEEFVPSQNGTIMPHGAGGKTINNYVSTQTNATADEIVRELSWAMR